MLESRQVTEAGAFPIRKMPVRVLALTQQVARRGDAAPAAAGGRAAAVPCRAVHRVHPARRRAAQLLDGQRAAHAGRARHRHRTAHPPPAGRQVHRPRVRRDEGKGNPAHRRPLRQLLPARGLRQADGAAGLGHRLRADQGPARAHEVQGHRPARDAVLGRAAARGPVHGRLGARAAGADAEPALRAGGVERGAGRQLARPHRLRAPGGDGRLRRSVGPPGVCLRRADRGRLGQARLRGASAACPRTSSSPTRSRPRRTRPCPESRSPG